MNPGYSAGIGRNGGAAEGKPLEGSNKYVLHFTKEGLPSVGAFWAVTMYDAKGFHVANKLDRFATGDRDEQKYNTDGSLDIYAQIEPPGADKESNWLPGPILLRSLYQRRIKQLRRRIKP